MKLAAIYLALLFATAAGLVALEVGWRPEFIPVWDGRATICARLAADALLFIAAVGSARALGPRFGQRRRVAVTLGYAWISCILFFVIGALQLDRSNTALENALIIAGACATGIAFGLIVGWLTSRTPADTKVEIPLSAPTTHKVLLGSALAVLLALSVVLAQPRARDDGVYTYELALQHGASTLKVGTFEVSLSLGRFAVLRLGDSGGDRRVVMERGEWRRLIELCDEADKHSRDNVPATWQTSDTVPGDPTGVALRSGSGAVTIELMGKTSRRFQFTTTPEEFKHVRDAMRRVDEKMTD